MYVCGGACVWGWSLDKWVDADVHILLNNVLVYLFVGGGGEILMHKTLWIS